mmetsp:Transcript_16116/g.25122  ORF Transcript_16116/g.25122 Transcript_16116/m.25122 type:complete len:123 (+) Transcript_16116:298-666(+)|eukprot:CAMPEP_0196820154 /NCGR_PEP_ID=MMETSP1362-20130617/73895_1 /TAXON_ID=163516 /ORGANISM="Leptocylindrus danicus, Strain CCMP1856" /LENGTH=122 /DNA_ID=CAMNT_0042198923 /DNA_START=278 /DNA_END=646 /DNA_ORIENTATION=-
MSKVLLEEPKKPDVFGNIVKLLTGRMCMDDGAAEDDNEQEDMKSSATMESTDTPMAAPESTDTPMSAPKPVIKEKVEPVVMSHEMMIQEKKEGALKFSESSYMFVYGFLLPLAIMLYLASSR